MCGCSSNSQIGKRRKTMAKKRKTTRRRRASVRGLNTNDAGALLMKGVLPGAAGAIILNKIVQNLLPVEYAQYSNYAVGLAGLGVALMVKNPMAKAAGLGAATLAATNVGMDLVDGQASAMGLLPPGTPSARVAGGGYPPRYSPFNGDGVVRQ